MISWVLSCRLFVMMFLPWLINGAFGLAVSSCDNEQSIGPFTYKSGMQAFDQTHAWWDGDVGTIVVLDNDVDPVTIDPHLTVTARG